MDFGSTGGSGLEEGYQVGRVAFERPRRFVVVVSSSYLPYRVTAGGEGGPDQASGGLDEPLITLGRRARES